jgi:hypothetical protein
MPDELDLNLESEQSPESGAPSVPETSLPSAQQEQATEATPSLSPSLLARAQQAGLTLDGIDSADKLNDFLLDQYVQTKPYADYGRQSLTTNGADQHRGHQAQEQEDQEPGNDEFDEQKFFSESWTVPVLSPGAQFAIKHGAFETDDNGFIVPSKEPHLQSLAMQYIKEVNDYQQQKATQQEAMLTNPVKFFAEKLLPYFEHKFSGKFQGLTEQRFQQYEHQNYEQKFIDENKSWLYTQDGKAFSPEGLKFRDAVSELRQLGVNDPQKLATYALKIAGVNTNSNAGTGAQDARQDADPTPAPNAGVVRDPTTGKFKAGTPPAPPTKQESFLEASRRKAGASASQGSFTEV